MINLSQVREVYLADNIDIRNGAEVMQMLKILREQGATIVMVTHSPSHAEQADRVEVFA